MSDLAIVNVDSETVQLIDREHVPNIFIAHIGTWKGEYIKVDTHGHFVSSFIGEFEVSISGSTYNQTNRYEYKDGRKSTLNFQGEFEQGVLKLSSSSYSDFSAIAWDAGQNTIGFKATKTQNEDVIVFMETITLLAPNHRVRSTQAFRNDVFDGISFIEELRQ